MYCIGWASLVVYIGEGQSFGNHGNTGKAHATPGRPIGYVPIEYWEISRQVHAVMRTGYWTSFLWMCFGVPNSLDIVMEVLTYNGPVTEILVRRKYWSGGPIFSGPKFQ